MNQQVVVRPRNNNNKSHRGDEEMERIDVLDLTQRRKSVNLPYPQMTNMIQGGISGPYPLSVQETELRKLQVKARSKSKEKRYSTKKKIKVKRCNSEKVVRRDGRVGEKERRYSEGHRKSRHT